MTSIASQKKMKFTSDYPIEKVMFLTSGSVVIPNGTFGGLPSVEIPHGLPFAPMPCICWSNTSDFAVTNVFGDIDYYLGSYAAFSGGGQYNQALADSTNISIASYNNSGSSKTVYYRIFCLAPSGADVDSEVEFTKNDGDKFIFNSDYNYMKLFKAGKLTTSDKTYTHNLGYVPRVMVWEKTGGFYSQDPQALIVDTDPTGSGAITSGVHVTSTQIIWLNPNTYDEIEYRIYLDE